MSAEATPCHAHIYYGAAQRTEAAALRDRFVLLEAPAGPILFVGAMIDHCVGPHRMAQYEVHFLVNASSDIAALIEPTGLRALIHPLTDDDLADHTTLGHWIGEPVELDVSVLDPPGQNQGLARFGRRDF